MRAERLRRGGELLRIDARQGEEPVRRGCEGDRSRLFEQQSGRRRLPLDGAANGEDVNARGGPCGMADGGEQRADRVGMRVPKRR